MIEMKRKGRVEAIGGASSFLAKTQMNRALPIVRMFIIIGLLFAAQLSVANENPIVIDLVDGRTGKPIPNEHILVFQGSTQKDVRAEKSHKNLQADTNGTAILTLDGPSVLRIQVWVDGYVLCQDTPNSKSYSVQKIRETGLNAPNNCSSMTRENAPNHFAVYVRHAHFWEKMRR